MSSWGEQYSAGDQSIHSRFEFFNSGYSTCPKCKIKNIKEDVNCAGCRHNGDGYGTVEFTCTACNWRTSFQYDEAASTYYYETANWERDPVPVRPPSPVLIDAEMKLTYARMLKLLTEDQVVAAMKLRGISDRDIENFLKNENSNR